MASYWGLAHRRNNQKLEKIIILLCVLLVSLFVFCNLHIVFLLNATQRNNDVDIYVLYINDVDIYVLYTNDVDIWCRLQFGRVAVSGARARHRHRSLRFIATGTKQN